MKLKYLKINSMGDIKGFIKYERDLPEKRLVEDRLKDWREIYDESKSPDIKTQSARCMDCGIPFCHSGCPLGNVIPDFNDAVYRNEWKEAYDILASTNNFPEFTGRICPAPCEGACVLGINNDPVTIEWIEKTIIEKAYLEGWVEPHQETLSSGKKVAVIGSGPAGLAAADQLCKAGHKVTLYERKDKPGGLLRYGIPDFKLEKWVVDRRIDTMKKSGIEFVNNAYIGVNIAVAELFNEYDAIVLAGGSTVARDLPIPGRDAIGVHLAMEYLEENNRLVAGEKIERSIEVRGKNVLVIGGGDTGSDCIGTSNRLKAKSVHQIEIMPMPPGMRAEDNPWPQWPFILRTSTSHEEGCDRAWNVLTKEFIKNEDGYLEGIKLVNVSWEYNAEKGRSEFQEVKGTKRILPCELVFLAIGFVSPEHSKMLKDLDVELDARGNVAAVNYQTKNPKVFVAGDMRRGQSLVVWAISEGREAAAHVDHYLRKGEEISRIAKKSVNILSV
jgi:glutamate synthase (NADPH/NADH) small chain